MRREDVTSPATGICQACSRPDCTGRHAVLGDAMTTTIVNGQTITVSSGTSTGFMVDSGGMLSLGNAGIAVSATLSGGTEVVGSGGISSDTVILSGGTETLLFGASANFTTLEAGGTFAIASGGVALDTQVNSGATLEVFGTPTLIGTLLLAG